MHRSARIVRIGVLVGLGISTLVSRAFAEAPATAGLPAPLAYVSKLGADRWHKAGIRGKGVKVAVLDTGFRGWKDHLGKALPANVIAKSFRSDGDLEARDSQHGILCGEVIHSIAPDAELLFANWESGHHEQFLAAIRWVKEQGAQVISCSCIMPSWSDGLGGGTVHAELRKLLGDGGHGGDLICFASAGNTTDRHWAGTFTNGGDGLHAWKSGVVENNLRPWFEGDVAVELYGKAGGAYEVIVLDAASNKEVGRAATDPKCTDRLSAAVRFPPETGHSYKVRIKHTGGPAGEFHVTTTFGSLEVTTPGANVCFPGDGSEVIAVGAVDSDGHRQPYSACGTNLKETKPDISACVPVPSAFRSRPFGGTSAACPQAAAIAALCLSKHPDWTPVKVRDSLNKSAVDLGAAGPDAETGYGLVQLPKE